LIIVLSALDHAEKNYTKNKRKTEFRWGYFKHDIQFENLFGWKSGVNVAILLFLITVLQIWITHLEQIGVLNITCMAMTL